MGNFIDLTGKQFSLLTVIYRVDNSSSNKVQWKCRCKCGGIAIATTGNLKTGITKSCGCLKERTPSNFVDITGHVFGRLKAVLRIEDTKCGRVNWLCVCGCGCMTKATSADLRSGKRKSCGCIKKEKSQNTKGMRETPEYKSWRHMKDRCCNPKNNNFEQYGARGITICDEWKNDFMAFYAHIGKRPSSKHSVDRIKNDKGYEPGNVKWSTRKEQANNTRRNRVFTFNGVSMNISQWAKHLGINQMTLYDRFNRGWSIEKALCEPVNH